MVTGVGDRCSVGRGSRSTVDLNLMGGLSRMAFTGMTHRTSPFLLFLTGVFELRVEFVGGE